MAEMYEVHSGTAEFCVGLYGIRKINQITHKVKICDNQNEFDSYECVNGEQKILCQFQRKNGKQDAIKPKYTNAYKMNKQKEGLDHLNKIQNTSEHKKPEMAQSGTTNISPSKSKEMIRSMNEQLQIIKAVVAINGTNKNKIVSTQQQPELVKGAAASNSLNKSNKITQKKRKSIDDYSSKINPKSWGIPSGDDSSSESDESDGDASMNQNNANTNNKQSIELKNKNNAMSNKKNSNKIKPKESIPAISNGEQRERQNDGPKPKANGLKFNQDSSKSMVDILDNNNTTQNKRIANKKHSKKAIKIRNRKRDQQNAPGPDDGNGEELKSNPVNTDNRNRQNYGAHAAKLQQSRPKVKLVEAKNQKISNTMPSTKAITPENHKGKRNNGNNLKANPLKSKEAMKGNKKIEKNLIGSKNTENSVKMEKIRPRKRRRSSISECFADNQLRVPKIMSMHKTKRRRLSENDVSNQSGDQKDALINKLNQKIKLKEETIANLRKQLKQKDVLIEQLNNPEEVLSVLNSLSIIQKFTSHLSSVMHQERNEKKREAKV